MTSPDHIAERLRAALTLDARDGEIDMSARAIEARLRDACEMSDLCLALAALSPDAPAPSRAAEPSERT